MASTARRKSASSSVLKAERQIRRSSGSWRSPASSRTISSSTLPNTRLIFVALLVIVAGYFGPWAAHPAAGLNLSADDLAEWVKFLPIYKVGDSGLIREFFFISIWLVPIGLGLLARRSRSWLIKLSLLGLALLLVFTPLPKYPELLTAYQAPEFAPTFWITVGSLVITIVLGFVGRHTPDRVVAAFWIVGGLAVASIAPLHFVKVLPEIERLYHVSIGWGLIATVLGGLSLSALGVRQLLSKQKPPV